MKQRRWFAGEDLARWKTECQLGHYDRPFFMWPDEDIESVAYRRKHGTFRMSWSEPNHQFYFERYGVKESNQEYNDRLLASDDPYAIFGLRLPFTDC